MCDKCQQTFTRKDNLGRHKRSRCPLAGRDVEPVPKKVKVNDGGRRLKGEIVK